MNKTRKRKYFCTRFEVRVRRDRYNLHPLSTETVGPYLSALLGFQRRLREIDWDAELYLGCSKEGILERERALEEEINHCKFFLEMAKRRTKDPNFDKWVFVPKDEKKWYRRHDAWVRDNGKIAAKVEIVPTPIRTKLQVSVEDSKLAERCGFTFASPGDGYETAAYEKPERILQEIGAAKVRLNEILEGTPKPRHSLNDLLEV